MSFTETLEKHLKAMGERELEALREPLPAKGLVLITSGGRVVRSVAEFLEMHRGWFEQTTWTLAMETLSLRETPETGLAVLRLDYRDTPAGASPIHEVSILTLVFGLEKGRWVMVHDQNTPVN